MIFFAYDRDTLWIFTNIKILQNQELHHDSIYRLALKAVYCTVDREPLPFYFDRQLLPHAPEGAEKILKKTLKEGYSRGCNYIIVAFPPLEVGGTLHLVYIISVGLNPDNLFIKYAGCCPFSYEDEFDPILWRNEAQNLSFQPP